MSSPRAVRSQRAALLAIGDEVLRGEVSNTNAAFLAERLFEAGYELAEQVVVSDDPQAIRTALVRLRAEMDVVIATGGLGPTEDDRTVDVVAELLVTGTSPDEPSLEAMKKRFSTHGFELTPNNLRQVRIPNGTRALPNTAGIAPGFVVPLGTAEAFFLPGVPREMEKMFTDEVMPRLHAPAGRAGRAAAGHAHLAPVRDGRIAHRPPPGRHPDRHRRRDAALPHRRTPSTTSSWWCAATPRARRARSLEKVEAELRKRIGPGIYGVDGETFPQAVAKSLKAQEATLAIAESCTGGLAGELVTSESGASVFFRGSIVAYHDEVKTGVLGVKPETIADFGAVSEPTAREMAEGAKRVCGSSVAVAITGIAGPQGGAADKPVGTVCFAVCGPGTTRASTKLFAGGRERVRLAAAYYALDLARRYFDTRKR